MRNPELFSGVREEVAILFLFDSLIYVAGVGKTMLTYLLS